MGSLPRDSQSISATVFLDDALQKVHQEYIGLHPLSAKSYKNACNYLPGGNTRTALYATPLPLTFSSGHEYKLRTVDGHEYIDFLGDHTAGIYGHNNPTIRKASHFELRYPFPGYLRSSQATVV